ncbi:HEXXH motif-containing putative peptide modification protein [Rhodococcus aetherivorans]|uniref:aKG-HExxH-type peptide beta-hydroxylase n=1 Tax=Rhodococcus aetherivorans TaxID=191292 RepID=UPI0036731ED2
MDARILDMVAGTYGAAVSAALVEHCRADITAATSGVVELIDAWSRRPPSFRTTWNEAFGQAELAIAGESDPVAAAVAIALRLTELGCDGHWRARIPNTRLRVAGISLGTVEHIEASPTAIVADGVECRFQDGGWTADRPLRLPSVGWDSRIWLLDAATAPEFDAVAPVAVVTPQAVEDFQRALDLAERLGYRPWIETVLRALVVAGKEDTTRMASGSTVALPGVVAISHPANLFDLLETLVHECAHQYFHLLSRYGAFDDGSDTAHYWSPAARAMRPVHRILVAYHALANVVILFDAMRDADVADDGYVERNIDTVLRKVNELDAPLRGNPALTALGRALYDPLAERVQHLQTGQRSAGRSA